MFSFFPPRPGRISPLFFARAQTGGMNKHRTYAMSNILFFECSRANCHGVLSVIAAWRAHQNAFLETNFQHSANS